MKADPKDLSKALYNGPHFVKRLNGTLAGLNDYMYRDVFAQFNSDFAFLVDAVENHGLKTRGTSELALARFHNRVAGAIHRASPGALVKVAAHSMPYTSDAFMKLEGWRPPARNLYSDAALVAAGGDEDGTLDFYQVHSYPNWQDPRDEFNSHYMPFLNPKTRWQLDKPLLVGEFWDAIGGKGEGTLSADAWYKLFVDGYAGGLGWAYFEVTEEFGGAAIVKGRGQPNNGGREPRRVVAKHQMRDMCVPVAPLIREVAKRLAEDRLREAETALVAPKGMPAATFAALRDAAAAAAAAGGAAGASGGFSVFAGGASVAGGGGAGGGGSEAPMPHSPSTARFASSDAIAKPRGPFRASSASSSSLKRAATSDAANSSDAAVAAAVPPATASAAPPLLLFADIAAELAAAFSHAADAARAGGASAAAAAPKAAAPGGGAAATTAAAADPAAAVAAAAATAATAPESSSSLPAAAAVPADAAAAVAAADAAASAAPSVDAAATVTPAAAAAPDAVDAAPPASLKDDAAVATAAAMLSLLDRGDTVPAASSSSASSASPATQAAAGSRDASG